MSITRILPTLVLSGMLLLLLPDLHAQPVVVPEGVAEQNFQQWLIMSSMQEAFPQASPCMEAGLTLKQTGSHNMTRTQQEGRELRIDAKQYGVDNTMDLQLTGEHLNSSVLQIGMSNQLDQRITGQSSTFSVIQLGTRLSIDMEQSAPLPPTLHVLQTGVGMRVVINQLIDR